MEEWKEYKLAEVCENIYSGGTPSSMNASYWNGNLPWLSSGETSQRYIYYTEKCITKEGADNSSTRYAFKGSTVIASAGQGHTRGQASMLCIDTYVNQSVLVIKPNPLIINPYFLYFNIDSRYNELRQLSDGTSTRGSLSGKILKDLKIYLPPLNEQQKIASILKSLDDKIEVNRKINENLEQQAQALFKSWFVDFEPFKNGEFVESELGMIPKGWRVVELSNLAEISKVSINPFKHPRTVFEHYSIPSYDNGMKPEIQLGEDIKSNKFVIENKMILFSKLNPRIKRVWYVDNLGVSPVCSTEFVPYKAIGESKSSFLYGLINSQEFYDFVMSMVNGATGSHQRFHPEESLKYKVAYNEEYCERYSAIITPVINQILVIRDESRRLAELRDTLLPKLMSGELKVNEIVR